MRAEFRASFPPTASAIRIHGEGGLRFTIDVSMRDEADAIAAMMFRGKNFSVILDDTPEVWTPAPDDLPPFDDDAPFDHGADNDLPFDQGNGHPAPRPVGAELAGDD